MGWLRRFFLRELGISAAAARPTRRQRGLAAVSAPARSRTRNWTRAPQLDAPAWWSTPWGGRIDEGHVWAQSGAAVGRRVLAFRRSASGERISSGYATRPQTV